ncbi:MAG: hypothetical protein AB7F35_07355, partial [Acetobacteraceae bacterium]
MAFATVEVASGRTDFMALPMLREAPPRFDALQELGEAIDQLLMPVAHMSGPPLNGRDAHYLICQAPLGSPLSTDLSPWTEGAIINQVLRPIAAVLDSLQQRRLTHRAIRPDNVFLGAPGRAVTLGAAWAAPSAMHQPDVFEPPYSAMCHPAARGAGTIADDVYALGVLLITLALGRMPMAGLDRLAVIRRKLELGSFAALVGDERLPPSIADLARNMLAEDPEHRPPPSLLLDPVSARGRRVAARPPRRAQRPLQIGRLAIWDARSLAHAIASEPELAAQAIRTGEVMQWLRRSLGDATLAVRIEELLRHSAGESRLEERRADAGTMMRAAVLIDPLAPLCWRGTALWPDGIPSALAAGVADDPSLLEKLEEIVSTEMSASWAILRSERLDLAMVRIEARRQRGLLQIRGPGGGLPRLIYTVNPLLPCASPMMRDRWVARLADLLPALEAGLGGTPAEAGEPLDNHIIAFIAARAERRLDTEVNGLNGHLETADRLLAQMRLLAQVQTRYWPQPLPRICAWFAATAAPLVSLWHNRPRREEVAASIASLAAAGFLTPILALIEDPSRRTADLQGARAAAEELRLIDTELASLTEGAAHRADQAARIGQEAAAG